MKPSTMKGIYALTVAIVIALLTGCATSPAQLQRVTIENDSSYTVFVQGVEIKQGDTHNIETDKCCFIVTAKIKRSGSGYVGTKSSVRRVKTVDYHNHIVIHTNDF
jgi:hypothetical protein